MKHKNLPIIGVLIIATLLMSFASDRSGAGSPGCRIVVGVGYEQKKCGGDHGASFSQAVEYFGIAAISDSYEPMRKSITKALQQFDNVNGRNISFSASTQPFCVVIGYEKKIAGWNCSVKRLAVGFGKSPAAAEDDAKNNKSKDAGTAAGSWVVKTYACG